MKSNLLPLAAIAAPLLLAGCAKESEPAEPAANEEQVARFLAQRDPPKDALIERKVDLEQATNLIAKAPIERSLER